MLKLSKPLLDTSIVSAMVRLAAPAVTTAHPAFSFIMFVVASSVLRLPLIMDRAAFAFANGITQEYFLCITRTFFMITDALRI